MYKDFLNKLKKLFTNFVDDWNKENPKNKKCFNKPGFLDFVFWMADRVKCPNCFSTNKPRNDMIDNVDVCVDCSFIVK